jgi:hypothetical protein
MDEELEVLLQGFGDGIIEYTKALRDRIDELEAEVYRTHNSWSQAARLSEQSRVALADIRGYLDDAERGRMTEGQAMALIRGRLLGG